MRHTFEQTTKLHTTRHPAPFIQLLRSKSK